MSNWCQDTIDKLDKKRRDGYTLTEDEAEAYNYAKNVIESEEAEIAYLNGEDHDNTWFDEIL